MSTESIKETEDCSTAGKASTDESVVIDNNIKLKQFSIRSKPDINGHSLNIIEDSIHILNDMIHFNLIPT